ncbi:hypothetical protein D5687_05840 [Guyparkeria sp. SCN-R1]|uniref:hypothetical protein n=1 Tax=Guyparkeria sp. SCN-R1 TaxID=2341113 RepID=UPI000F64927F|nr:hypothetical protein [Guyparkeria sp. SCN-R1]RRQ23784.1 hypothetical protein D5687_05840 [Guyparkeria sp. SCN-R1]
MADKPLFESPEKHTARLLISWGVRFTRLLGIAGVADHESHVAQRWAVRLELPLLLISLWIPVQWYLEHTGQVAVGQGFWVDLLIWGFFLVEQLILLALVKDKVFYLKSNWLLVAVVAIGVPLILIEAVAFLLGLRLLRVLLVVITALSRASLFSRAGPARVLCHRPDDGIPAGAGGVTHARAGPADLRRFQ